MVSKTWKKLANYAYQYILFKRIPKIYYINFEMHKFLQLLFYLFQSKKSDF